jgi:hypothetical protein
MKVDMDLGDTRLIVSECMRQGLLRNQAAYVLATAYWESGRTMAPVKEAFWLSESWREKNLRYYPWYGRGFVQLTWERNYIKAGKELGLDLTTDPDVVMEPDVSVQILVIGSREGWFTGKRLDDYITLKASNYRGARRVINGTDKAAAIAEIAREYEETLVMDGYGVEAVAPVVDDRRDGTAPRSNPAASSTNQATLAAAAAAVAGQSETVKEAVGGYSEAFGVAPQIIFLVIVLAGLGWIFRERLRKWANGDR